MKASPTISNNPHDARLSQVGMSAVWFVALVSEYRRASSPSRVPFVFLSSFQLSIAWVRCLRSSLAPEGQSSLAVGPTQGRRDVDAGAGAGAGVSSGAGVVFGYLLCMYAWPGGRRLASDAIVVIWHHLAYSAVLDDSRQASLGLPCGTVGLTDIYNGTATCKHTIHERTHIRHQA